MLKYCGPFVRNDRITESLEFSSDVEYHAGELQAVFGAAVVGAWPHFRIHYGPKYIREYAEIPMPSPRDQILVSEWGGQLAKYMDWIVTYPATFGSMSDDPGTPYLVRERLLTQVQRETIAKFVAARAAKTTEKATERMEHEIARARATLQFYGVEL